MKIIITNPKRAAIFWGAALTVVIIGIISGVFIWEKNKNKISEENLENQPQIYETLTQIKDEKNPDLKEDAKSSMKAGDVLVIFPEGHLWSETEKISHLILKLKLKQEDADKLIMPETKKVKKTKEELEAMGNDGGEEYNEEIIRARKYRLKIEKLDFDPNAVWKAQPFPDKIFGEEMIEEK